MGSYAIDEFFFQLSACEQKKRDRVKSPTRLATILPNVKSGGGGRAGERAPRSKSIERLIDERVIATNVNKRVLRGEGSVFSKSPGKNE